MNALTQFTLTDSTRALIVGAETAKSEAAESGVNAVIALATDNAAHIFRHGDAAKLGDVLRANGFKAAVSKFYSEKTATVTAFIQRKALLAVKGMPRGQEKTAAYNEAITQALRDLSLLKSVAAVMAKVRPAKVDETPAAVVDEPAAVVDLSIYQILAIFAAGIHAANVAAAMAAKAAKPAKPAEIAA